MAARNSAPLCAFEEQVLDSDDELLEVNKEKTEYFHHIYEIYMKLGRTGAIALIEEAEKALIAKWAADSRKMIISLGPSFPLRDNWQQLRAISYVVLFRKIPSEHLQQPEGPKKEDLRMLPECSGAR
jgi:hypothetical protein